MERWETEPLWQFFELHGVNVRTMTAYPLAGPVWVEPTPESTHQDVVTSDEGETDTIARRASETLQRVQDFVRRSLP